MEFSVILFLLKGKAVYRNWIGGACRLKFCEIKLRGYNGLSLFSSLLPLFYLFFPLLFLLVLFLGVGIGVWKVGIGVWKVLNGLVSKAEVVIQENLDFLICFELFTSWFPSHLCWLNYVEANLLFKKQTKILSRIGHLLEAVPESPWNVGEECSDPLSQEEREFWMHWNPWDLHAGSADRTNSHLKIVSENVHSCFFLLRF